ncbi:MAG: DMT family transporter [Pontibacterium sp.]
MNNHLRADLVLVLVTVLAALGWVFTKEGFGQLPPVEFISTRFVCAALILLCFSHKQLRRFTSTQWMLCVRSGVLFAISILVWAIALDLSHHMGVGAFLTSLGILLVPLVRVFSADKPKLIWWCSLPVAGAGLACLSLDSHFVFGVGEYLFLLAAALFALYFTVNSHAASRVPTAGLATVTLFVTGVLTGIYSAFTEVWVFAWSGETVMWFLLSVVIATSLRFFLQSYGQSLADVSHTAVIMILEPVWTAIFAAIWFAESMSLLQVLGCALIFSALVLNRWNMVLGWLRLKRAV